ncbi:MAG: antibiotic biosynthesis monooxygenase family protein [Planctomycetota bacterium]
MNLPSSLSGAIVVIFHARHHAKEEGYAETSAHLSAMVEKAPGFLGMDSLREDDASLTVSYWSSEEDVATWQQEMEHLAAQKRGRAEWYRDYQVIVAKAFRSYEYMQEGPA